MRLVKRGRVGGLRGPGLAPADLALIDGKVDEAAGYAATAAAQLPAVIAAKDDALADIAAATSVIDGKVDEAEAAQAAAAAQAAIAAQKATEAALAVGALGRPEPFGSTRFPRKHGRKSTDDWAGFLQPSAGLIGAFSGDTVIAAIVTMPQECMFGNFTYSLMGADGGATIDINGRVRAAGSGQAPALVEPVLEWRIAGNGTNNGVIVEVPMNRGLRRVMIGAIKGGTTTTAFWVSLDALPGGITRGAGVTNASFTGVNQIRGANGLMLGGFGYNNTGPNALGGGWSDGLQNYWPGDIEWIWITNTAMSDAQILDIAAGADPVAVMGGAAWKFIRDFRSGEPVKPAGVTSDTTAPAVAVRGTGPARTQKGPHIRRQSLTEYLLPDYIEEGQIWAVARVTDEAARVRVKGVVGGYSGKVRAVWYREDTSIYYTEIIGTIAAGATTFDFTTSAPITDGMGHFAVEAVDKLTLRASVSKWCGVGYSACGMGQSQERQLNDYVDQALKAPYNTPITFVCQRGENDGTQAIEGTFQRLPIGSVHNSDGFAGLAKRWREITTAPLVFIEEAVGGTGAHNLLLDGDADVPDLRNPGNILHYDAHDALPNESLAFNPYSRPWDRWRERVAYASGLGETKGILTVGLWNWISADNAGTFYTDMIARPFFFAEGPGQIPEFMHYFYDGKTFANAPVMALQPANRHLDLTPGPLASGHTLTPLYGQGRDTQENWWEAVGGIVGPPAQSLRNEKTADGKENGPHVSHAVEPGSYLYGQMRGETILRAVGLSNLRNPYISRLRWEDPLTRLALLADVEMVNGGRLRTYRNLDDGTGQIVVRGFEVNWAGTTGTPGMADWSWEEADSTKGLIARLLPGIKNSRRSVRLSRPNGAQIPNSFLITCMYGAPLHTGYLGAGFDWILDTLHDGSDFGPTDAIGRLGISVRGSAIGGSLKQWTIADVVAS